MRSKIINIIAYTGTVVGIGGIVGAIERGTSLAAAVVCLGVGCICMGWSYKRGDKKQNEETSVITAFSGNDDAFCGWMLGSK